MKRTWKALKTIALVVVSGKLAFSYLNPRTGSLILQVLIGGVLSLAFLVKLFWRQLTGIFRRSDESATELSPERAGAQPESEESGDA
jgi:hypothetical protein